MVPQDQRWRLLATFNAGFIYAQGHNGSTDQRTRERAALRRQRDPARLQERRCCDREVERRPKRRPERRLGTPEPRPDRLERTPQPRAEHGPEQLPMGLYARGRRPRLAHRDRHRPSRQPHLRRGSRPDRDHPRADPSARRRGTGDGARHQPRMAHPDHLRPPPRSRPDDDRAPTDAVPRPATSSPTTATSSPSTDGSQAPSPSRSASRVV